MSKDELPAREQGESGWSRLIRRLGWRQEVGPLRAEAGVEVRELDVPRGPENGEPGESSSPAPSPGRG